MSPRIKLVLFFTLLCINPIWSGCLVAHGVPVADGGKNKVSKRNQDDNCVAENNKIVCSIKESEPKALGPIQVPNFSKVTIRVTEKSPFDDCALAEVKLTEIKVADPITTILGLLTKAATGAPLPATVTS